MTFGRWEMLNRNMGISVMREGKKTSYGPGVKKQSSPYYLIVILPGGEPVDVFLPFL